VKSKILVGGMIVFVIVAICISRFKLNLCRSANKQMPVSIQQMIYTYTGTIGSNSKKVLQNTFSQRVLSKPDVKRIDNPALKHDTVFPTLYYSHQSSLLSTSHHSQLEFVTQFLNAWPGLHCFIIGYAGRDEKAAMELALQRAEMVKSFLVRKGIDKKRLSTIASGDLLDQHVFQSKQQHNRKVRFRVY